MLGISLGMPKYSYYRGSCTKFYTLGFTSLSITGDRSESSPIAAPFSTYLGSLCACFLARFAYYLLLCSITNL